MTKDLFNRIYFGAWIIVERHFCTCTCSYCRQTTRKTVALTRFVSLGLWLPECKANNSWRVLFFDRPFDTLYIRWTLPKSLKPFGRKLI